MMGKVFGYPEFDQHGEMVLTTYDGNYAAILLPRRSVRLSKRLFCQPEQVFKTFD